MRFTVIMPRATGSASAGNFDEFALAKPVALRAALVLLTLLVIFATEARAVTINWTPVGDQGNANDPADGDLVTIGIQHFGAVPYAYNIDKYEVTNSQYGEFLNAVAKTDTYDLYNPKMSSLLFGGINRSGSPGSYSYSVATNYGNVPVNSVSWGDAARFANWLSNGQPSGPQNGSTTEDGSYFLNGAITQADLSAVTREADATIVVPSENEWYKAAYYNPASSSYFQYPTSSNTVPSNAFLDAGNNANFYNKGFTTVSPNLTDVGHFATSASPYGTFDQGGNVWEWNETFISDLYRGLRGGSSYGDSFYLLSSSRYYYDPTYEDTDIGFRVASLSVPEPSSGAMAVIACGMMWWWRKRFK